MNIWQRIVLVIGAGLFWPLIFAPGGAVQTLRGVVNLSAAQSVWFCSIFWCITVAAIYFAVGKRKS
jgi:hypothetical protein